MSRDPAADWERYFRAEERRAEAEAAGAEATARGEAPLPTKVCPTHGETEDPEVGCVACYVEELEAAKRYMAEERDRARRED